jgi:predicted amidohydrolase YtcJ
MKLLITGAAVVTVDENRPRAEAVGIENGVIVAVGAEVECRVALGENAATLDLQGGALLPGFIDAHLHPSPLMFYDMNANVHDVTTLAELQEHLRDQAAHAPEPAWIVGLDFDEQNLAERRLPTRHDLDAATDRPVMIFKHDGHTVIGNTAAIAAAGVTAATPDPPGGSIDREPSGFPAGAFRENAAPLLKDAAPFPSMDDLAAASEVTFGRLAAHGITSLGAVMQTDDYGPAGAAGASEMMALSALLHDRPKQSLYGLLFANDAAPILAARQTPLHQAERGGHFIGALKIIVDGTLGSCTAWVSEPFADHQDKTGFLLHEEAEIFRRMAAAHEAGLQIAAHAIGDRAIGLCLDNYDRLQGGRPGPHRHRIEHASVLNAELIDKMARLGVCVVAQPLFIDAEKHWLERRLGPERARWVYPLRALVDAGVTVAGSSDAPVESTHVMAAIQAAVTRSGFQTHQCLTVDEAIRLFTANAAYLQHEEDIKGTITPGKRADLVALSADPTRVPPETIGEIRVRRTWRGGEPTFVAEGE